MNREIKFRAWDKLVNQWVKFNQPPKAVTGKSTSRILNIHGSDDNVVFMQFTGLKDKNGQEIYEGDIVKIDGMVGKVFWDKEWTQFKCQWTPHQFFSLMTYPKNREVIGNIYENKELLK